MKMILFLLLTVTNLAAQGPRPMHLMQHGFILSDNDKVASHLVAQGHHSWQATVSGRLQITNETEAQFYLSRKRENQPQPTSYFVFQAQKLDLPSLKVGQELRGHIIESKRGDYEPRNKIVNDATFTVEAIHINVINPFFTETE